MSWSKLARIRTTSALAVLFAGYVCTNLHSIRDHDQPPRVESEAVDACRHTPPPEHMLARQPVHQLPACSLCQLQEAASHLLLPPPKAGAAIPAGALIPANPVFRSSSGTPDPRLTRAPPAHSF